MSAGILEKDKGAVWGGTWHNNPQYGQFDRPITYAEALGILDYEVVKIPNYIDTPNGRKKVDGSYTLVRADSFIPLVAVSVGEEFTVLPNSRLLEGIQNNLLIPYPDLKIESVGTLWNGQTNFVNIVIDKYHVNGDESEILHRLLYFNPIGRGAYKVCAHDIRVVCNNTLKAAFSQGVANKTLARIQHSISAGRRIERALVDLAELKMGLSRQKDALNYLASQTLDATAAQVCLNEILPIPEDEGKGKTIIENRQQEILAIFESQMGFVGNTKHSKYALLNAITYYIDHGKLTHGNDEFSRAWNGIVGAQADDKVEAFRTLMGDSTLLNG